VWCAHKGTSTPGRPGARACPGRRRARAALCPWRQRVTACAPHAAPAHHARTHARAPAEDDVERGLQRLHGVREGDGHRCKAHVGGEMPDRVHERGPKDLAKLVLGHGLPVCVCAGGARGRPPPPRAGGVCLCASASMGVCGVRCAHGAAIMAVMPLEPLLCSCSTHATPCACAALTAPRSPRVAPHSRAQRTSS
jgi:hypothetical protein